MTSKLARLARMDREELVWRASAGMRVLTDRLSSAVHRPRWDRRRLLPLLSDGRELDDVRFALRRQQWPEAHRALSRHFMSSPQRFPLSRSRRSSLVGRITSRFPDSTLEAIGRADRILAGEYDLLGYRSLHFVVSESGRSLPRPLAPPDPLDPPALPDWHFDPVHDRPAPRQFWSTVDYLDPACGDHKIIWELNRHQHWLALGRAYWLSNDSRYRDRFRAELASWLAANPPLAGINWASMLELGLRSLSWLWALHFFVESPSTNGVGDRRTEAWTVDILLALDRQLTHVERNLSSYFSPNTHLLGEALALYVAGRALPELAAGARWQATGRRLLLAEVQRQIGDDGGHCERSPHYHRYALDFYMLAFIVARLTRDPAARDLECAVRRLAIAARLLADASGRLPHIGDDDGGSLFPIAGRAPDDIRDSLAIAAALVDQPELAIGPPPEEVLWMLGPEYQFRDSAIRNPASGIRSAALADTGYYISRSDEGDHLVVDGGPHGYQNGGHSHADALSLTLTVRGLPLLIDPGTGSYTIDRAVRDRLRSSALHNTLTLDDRSQSIPAGPFHWLHTANSRVHRWRMSDRFDYFDGSQNGYRPVEHRRRVLVLHQDLLIVSDFVDATGAHAARVHWHIHPEWIVDVHGRRVILTRREARSDPARDASGAADPRCDRITLVAGAGIVDVFHGDAASGLGWYSPAYGRLLAASTIRVTHAATGPFWMASVFDLGSDNPIHEVEWLTVSATACELAHGAMLRISRAASIDQVLWAEPTPSAGKTSDPGMGASETAPPPLVWRAGDFETDARMLFSRLDARGQMTWLALVDGSTVRDSDGRTRVALPQRAPVWDSDCGSWRAKPTVREDRVGRCGGQLFTGSER
jgi:hypothetical protein